jgi:hypothetical protein
MNQQIQNQSNMFNRTVVQEALKRSWAIENNPASAVNNKSVGQNTVIPLLIHDIFGGEILKTHKKKGWHYYNMIDGERIDFTSSEIGRPAEKTRFEDIPSSPDETNNYYSQEDYSTFLMRFVMAFEEAVGLENYKPGCSV